MSNYKITAYIDDKYIEKNFRFIDEAIKCGEELADSVYDHVFLLVRKTSGFYEVTKEFYGGKHMKNFIDRAIEELRYRDPYGASDYVKDSYEELYNALRTLYVVGLINKEQFNRIIECDFELFREYFQTRKNAE